MATVDQPSLFSTADLPAIRSFAVPAETLKLSFEALQSWKQRVFEFQQQVRLHPPAQQGNLFEAAMGDRANSAIELNSADASSADPDSIDPFKLPQQNTEFWRWKAEDAGVAALYFVIDYQLPLLLYVGETVKSNQRWKGEHDCKRYLMNYVTAHRSHEVPVKVNIGFWAQAPVQTRPRQRLELALINKWRSPFNKENWKFWGTPFIGEK